MRVSRILVSTKNELKVELYGVLAWGVLVFVMLGFVLEGLRGFLGGFL